MKYRLNNTQVKYSMVPNKRIPLPLLEILKRILRIGQFLTRKIISISNNQLLMLNKFYNILY